MMMCYYAKCSTLCKFLFFCCSFSTHTHWLQCCSFFWRLFSTVLPPSNTHSKSSYPNAFTQKPLHFHADEFFFCSIPFVCLHFFLCLSQFSIPIRQLQKKKILIIISRVIVVAFCCLLFYFYKCNMYIFFVCFFVCAIAQVISASNTAENNFCYLLQNVTRFRCKQNSKKFIKQKVNEIYFR